MGDRGKDLPKVQVNVGCPVCGFYKSLGVVNVKDVREAQMGEGVPFTVDYRKFIGGKGHGIINERRSPGVVPYRLLPAWLAFVERIKVAFEAVRCWVDQLTVAPVPLMVLARGGLIVGPRVVVLARGEVNGEW